LISLRRTGFALAGLVLGAAACSKDETVKRELTQREKDSILGASQIPGARAVQKTLRAADSAAARQARFDSAEQTP
jgi:hypothetical protein